MKNKETILGYVLLMLLMFGLFYYQTKKAEEEAKNRKAAKKEQTQTPPPASDSKAAADSVNTLSLGSAPVEPGQADSAALHSKLGALAASVKGEEKIFTLENEVLKLKLSTKGAQIKSVELKKYKTWDGKPLILLSDNSNSLSCQFFNEANEHIDTRNFYFETSGEAFSVTGDSVKSLSLRLPAGEGKYFEQIYTLKGNSYLIDYHVNLAGLNSIIPANVNTIDFSWKNKILKTEHLISTERTYSALYYKYHEGDVTHLSDVDEKDELVSEAPLEWISYKQQFFNVTFFSKGDFQKGTKLVSTYSKTSSDYVKKYEAQIVLPYSGEEKINYSFQFFFGPNHYNTLSKLDKDAESIIRLGPDFWLFAWIKYITRFIIWVFSWFNSVNLNYGIIILLMTLILKLVLHPLTAKSIESSAKMKILQPEIAALKEKYGDDQTKISQEQMKIFQKAGVSPLGGCLPLLLQMPILMAMYYFFPASIELRQEPFLWATDLSSYDAIVTFSTSFPLIGNHISLFTILMTITSIGQAVMSSQMNAMANQQPGMKYMPYFMPVVLMFLFNDFPAALTYYYLLQNVLGMAHQWIIQKFFINETKLRKQIEEHKKNPKPASGWQKKLADIQKQAEQRSKRK